MVYQKKHIIHCCLLLVVVLLQHCLVCAQNIVVDVTGKGNYTSIQAAINSLSDDATTPRIILIKNGVYNEQVFISKNNIVLKGESRVNTILTQSIARDAFRCTHNDDWGVAALNLKGNDITLINLTVQNTYGFDNTGSITIPCPNDTVTHTKVIKKDGHQMALRSFSTTRLAVINCLLKAYAGDTVSPWNLEDGMFYFKDCTIEGGVDFYCPRGWAYAENCVFIANTGSASIWHDGSKYEDSKTVLNNCSFKGFDGFNLGRYHKDAQFYLLNCVFADNMKDQNIYRVATTNTIQWGERIYYFNCHRKAGDYKWFTDNLQTAKGAPKPADIKADWVFNGKWNALKQVLANVN